MPVDFLTEAQRKCYGHFAGEPAPDQLARYFHLDESDHRFIAERRGDCNKFGYALQLCTVRFLGTFLANPIDAPDSVIAYLGAQLGIDRECLPHYLERRPTRMEHAVEITNRLGYKYFDEQPKVALDSMAV